MRILTIAPVALMSFLVLSLPAPDAIVYQNPIVIENRLEGSDRWRLNLPGFHVADDIRRQIKGFASLTSVNRGEEIQFFVTVNPVQTYTIDIFRMGWYGGLGGRHMLSIGPLEDKQQPPCLPAPRTGRIECDWSAGYTLQIPKTWVSGAYVGLLTNEQKFQNYILFLVRDDESLAPILYQQSVTTFQAYNNYPNDGETGKSLYDNNSFGDDTIVKAKRAVEVSFDRPYFNSGAEHFFSADWSWEYYFIRWLERSGYDVTYSTNVDTHANGDRLQRHAVFLSVGHDEYWSKPMFDAAEAARDSGTHLAFFGANAVYWQIRFAASRAGRSDRAMICFKNKRIDPEPDLLRKTIEWRKAGRPEQTLIGVQFGAWADPSRNTNWVVKSSDHWVYEGTGFRDGDRGPRIIGYEIDYLDPMYPLPKYRSYTLLSDSPYADSKGKEVRANASIYQSTAGSWVFGAGTNSWSWALDRPGYMDSRIQRITSNILNRFLETDVRTIDK